MHSGRRPADVWIPRWKTGTPAAWDFAVTSGLQATALRDSAVDAMSSLSDYERFKRTHDSTEVQCNQQGFVFEPLVVEAHGGGWGITARKVWSFLSKAIAAKEGRDESATAAELQQRISITLQRENARAVLRRMCGSSQPSRSATPAAWSWDEADEEAQP